MLKARYDAREDRMLLILEPKDSDRRAFWVTRRQWLGLYAGLGPVKPEKPQAKQPAPKPQSLPESLTSGAVALDSIKMRRRDEAVQIAFVADDKPVGLQVKGDSLTQLQRLLEQQAERAGWDAHAALARMKAAVAAGAAVRKAKG